MTADCGPQQHEQEEDWGAKLVRVAGVAVKLLGYETLNLAALRRPHC